MHQYKSRHLFLLCVGQSKQVRRIWTIGNQPVLGAVSGRHFCTSFKNKLSSEPCPGTNLRGSKNLATRYDDCISEPALKAIRREHLARNNPHFVQLRLQALQKFSDPTIKR